MPSPITYRDGLIPPIETIAALYRAAELRRPVADLPRITLMYAGANIVETAWDSDRLAGILRGWTDGAFDGYVSDLAVHPDYQRQGIGQELLRRVVERDRQVQFVLRASQIAREYYRHIGWQAIENGWYLPRES